MAADKDIIPEETFDCVVNEDGTASITAFNWETLQNKAEDIALVIPAEFGYSCLRRRV